MSGRRGGGEEGRTELVDGGEAADEEAEGDEQEDVRDERVHGEDGDDDTIVACRPRSARSRAASLGQWYAPEKYLVLYEMRWSAHEWVSWRARRRMEEDRLTEVAVFMSAGFEMRW